MCGADVMMRRMSWTRIQTLAAVTVIVGGCVTGGSDRGVSRQEAAPVTLRFHVGAGESREGYEAVRDEAGRPLFVDPAPFLTERHVLEATAMHSDRRSLVLVRFRPAAAAELEWTTAAHVRDRLVVYVDDALVMSPPIEAAIVGGRVLLDGGFSRGRADEIAAGLTTAAAAVERPLPG